MGVVLGVVVGDAGGAAVDVGAAQLLGRDHLAGRGLHQRRAGEEDGALVADDDALVAHRRHVGAAGGAASHHHRDLGDALRRQVGLVVEDAAEVVAAGEDLVLVGQVGAAGIDQVDAGQAVLLRDLLRAEVLLHRQGEVGAALHRRVVGDDHALAPGDAADAGDDPGRGHLAAIHAVRRELADLQEGRHGVDQRADAVARQQLAAREVPVARRLPAALAHALGGFPEVRHQFAHRLGVGAGFGGAQVQRGLDHRHVGAAPSFSASKLVTCPANALAAMV